jgi:DNA polymerase-4
MVLEDLPAGELCGIGPSLTQGLAAMGIRTCGELGRAPLRKLTERFGLIGERLRDMGLGKDDDPVASPAEQLEEESKSMGHSMTLAEDCTDIAAIERHILLLSEKVGRRLRRGSYHGHTVSLTLRYSDFHTFSRQRRLRHAVNHGLDIYSATREILGEVRPDRPVRLVGVSVSGLRRDAAQMPLFDDERKRSFIALAMDDINDRYGDFTVTWGTLALRHHHERIISPAWRPEGDRKY